MWDAYFILLVCWFVFEKSSEIEEQCFDIFDGGELDAAWGFSAQCVAGCERGFPAIQRAGDQLDPETTAFEKFMVNGLSCLDLKTKNIRVLVNRGGTITAVR